MIISKKWPFEKTRFLAYEHKTKLGNMGVFNDSRCLATFSMFVPCVLALLQMSFATISHVPDVELPDGLELECPHDAVSLIEEWHQGLHKILISKQLRRNSYKPIGSIICQTTKDRHGRPEATPDELGEYVMQWIQYEIEESDDPGKYRMILKGPPGKGAFEKSKHIDLTGEDGSPRTTSMLNEGDMLEQQGAYIGELHSQIVGMIELVVNSHKTVVNENREMMKILSEATRKHGEIERDRLKHQLEMKMHEDEVKAQDAEAQRSLEKFREGLDVFKKTGAAEELIRAVAKKIQGKNKQEDKERKAKEDAPENTANEPSAAPATAIPPGEGKKKRGRFAKKPKPDAEVETPDVASEEVSEEELPNVDPEWLEEGRQMVQDRPMVTAAEALKMTINENGQWGLLRKTLTDEQMDILDDIFSSASDDEVIENAQRLYDAEGLLNMAELNEKIDDQQRAFIQFIMKNVEQ